jgi:hypothetical protein
MKSNDITNEGAAEYNALTALISEALFMLDKETPGDSGVNYKPLYLGIFNGISLILENTATYEQTIAALKHLQCKAENAFIEQGEK